jgi:hypothetical protein
VGQLDLLQGVYILENLSLEELARDRQWEFAFIAAPLGGHRFTFASPGFGLKVFHKRPTRKEIS